MTIATKFGGFTSATVIRLLVSFIKLPSESSAMTLRLGKAAVSPSAKGIQSPMLQPKKLAPSRLKSDQKAVFDDRLVTVSICGSTIGAKSLRQSRRFIKSSWVQVLGTSGFLVKKYSPQRHRVRGVRSISLSRTLFRVLRASAVQFPSP